MEEGSRGIPGQQVPRSSGPPLADLFQAHPRPAWCYLRDLGRSGPGVMAGGGRRAAGLGDGDQVTQGSWQAGRPPLHVWVEGSSWGEARPLFQASAGTGPWFDAAEVLIDLVTQLVKTEAVTGPTPPSQAPWGQCTPLHGWERLRPRPWAGSWVHRPSWDPGRGPRLPLPPASCPRHSRWPLSHSPRPSHKKPGRGGWSPVVRAAGQHGPWWRARARSGH